ncbi:acyl-CoA dehydrogenase family protein [Arthrobacter sp. MMS24-T111]
MERRVGTPLPAPQAAAGTRSRREQPRAASLRTRVRALLDEHVTQERLRHFDEAEEYDLELYRELGKAGLLALEDDAHPGHPSHVSQTVVLEELAAGPTSVAVSMVVQYMGVQLLHSHGTADHKGRFLDPLQKAEARMSFALSEPGGGTDVARAMQTMAIRRPDGSYSITGRKKWIGGAMDADFLVVLARTGSAGSAIDGITTFLVPRSTPGIRTEEIPTMGIRALAQCDVYFDDVRVPGELVLGEVGKGFRQVLGTLNGERLNAAAVALGIAQAALDAAVAWSKTREAFGHPIGHFQSLQHSLVNAGLSVESARLLLREAAESSDAHDSPDETLSAMAKLGASNAATQATDAGMRLMAGWGFARELPMQRYFRDARLYTFAPLTDEMMRNFLGEKLLGLPRSY